MSFLGIEAIGTFISGAISVVYSTISTVGAAITVGATALIAKLLTEYLVAKFVMDTIGFIISKVAEFFGLAQENKNVDGLGAKVMQEDTRPKMEGESTQEYLDYLRKVPLDEEKYAKISDAEKMACSELGATMITQSIEEKTGVEFSPEFLLI